MADSTRHRPSVRSHGARPGRGRSGSDSGSCHRKREGRNEHERSPSSRAKSRRTERSDSRETQGRLKQVDYFDNPEPRSDRDCQSDDRGE